MNNEIRELSIDELDGISGGAPNTSTPSKKTASPKQRNFELVDFSFGIEQVLN